MIRNRGSSDGKYFSHSRLAGPSAAAAAKPSNAQRSTIKQPANAKAASLQVSRKMGGSEPIGKFNQGGGGSSSVTSPAEELYYKTSLQRDRIPGPSSQQHPRDNLTNYHPIKSAPDMNRKVGGNEGQDQIYWFVDFSNVFWTAGVVSWKLLPGGDAKVKEEQKDDKIKAAAAEAQRRSDLASLGFESEEAKEGDSKSQQVDKHDKPGFSIMASWLKLMCAKLPEYSAEYMQATVPSSFLFMSQSPEREQTNNLKNSLIFQKLSRHFDIHLHTRVNDSDKTCIGANQKRMFAEKKVESETETLQDLLKQAPILAEEHAQWLERVRTQTAAVSAALAAQKCAKQDHPILRKDPGRGDNHEKGVDLDMALQCWDQVRTHEETWPDRPGTVVICSSDSDFKPLIARLLKAKWQVLLWGWNDGIGHKYREWLKMMKQTTKLLALNYFDDCLFQLGVPRNHHGRNPLLYQYRLLIETPNAADAKVKFDSLALWTLYTALSINDNGSRLCTQQYLIRWKWDPNTKVTSLILFFYEDSVRKIVLDKIQEGAKAGPIFELLQQCKITDDKIENWSDLSLNEKEEAEASALSTEVESSSDDSL